MTLLQHPATAPPRARSLAAALQVAEPSGSLLLIGHDGRPDLADLRAALRRETRAADWVGREGRELVVVLDALPADLDAVADRLLSVAERASGLPCAGGLTALGHDRSPGELLDRARSGLRVAWACGGGRVVRHP